MIWGKCAWYITGKYTYWGWYYATCYPKCTLFETWLLHFRSSSLLMSWESNRRWPKFFSSCHSHGRPRWNPWLWPGPTLAVTAIWGVSWQMEDFSLSLPSSLLLKGKVTDIRRDREGSIFRPLGHFPNGCKSQSRGNPQPDVCSFSGSPTWAQGSKHLGHAL